VFTGSYRGLARKLLVFWSERGCGGAMRQWVRGELVVQWTMGKEQSRGGVGTWPCPKGAWAGT
jgi:hypothetical protein